MVELRNLSSYLGKAWYSISPMDYDELRAAVEKPAAKVNLQFQPGIVDELVRKVLGQPAALPLLQFTLKALWDERDRNRITSKVYEEIGDPLHALQTTADRFYDGLPLEDQAEVRRLLLELVRVDDLLEAYRQPVAKSRLLQAGSAKTEYVLKLLERNDYVRITSGTSGGDAVVEVKHESLVRNWPRLVDWIADKRHQRRQRLAYTQAAQRWADAGKPPEGLLTGWQLQSAEGLSDLSELEEEFVQASKEALNQRESDLRTKAEQAQKLVSSYRLALATTLISAVIIFALFSVIDSQRLTRERMSKEAEMVSSQLEHMKADRARMEVEQKVEETRGRERILQALNLQPLNYVNDQLDLALLLSIEASRIAPEAQEVRRSLISTLTTNLELEALLPGDTDTVRAVAFSPNGKVLASATDDKIILWDVRNRLMIRRPLQGHEGPINKLTFSANGETLVSASSDHSVRLWSVNSGNAVGAPIWHDTEVYGVAIRKDGKALATGSKDGTVRIWNFQSQKQEARFVHSKSGKPVTNVAFSPNGTLLASGGEDGRIVLWDMQRRKQSSELMADNSVLSMAFSHDGRTIASGKAAGGIDIWDVTSRKKIGSSLAHLRDVSGVAFSPDDRKLATVSRDRRVYLHNLDAVRNGHDEPENLRGYAAEFLSVDFSISGEIATGTETSETGSKNGMVVLWDSSKSPRLGKWLQRDSDSKLCFQFGKLIQTAPGLLSQVVFSADKTTLFGALNDQVEFFPVEYDSEIVDAPIYPTCMDAGQRGIKLIVPATKEDLFVTIGADNSIKLWSGKQRRLIDTLAQPSKEAVVSASFDADDRVLTVALKSQDKIDIRLLSVPRGEKPSSTLDGNPESIPLPPQIPRFSALALNSDRKLLAIGGQFGIKVWKFDTSDAVTLLQTDLVRDVISLSFSADGKVLAAGGEDSVVRLWNLENGFLVSAFAAHRGAVTSLAFNPDGSLLASGSSDRVLLLWEVRTGRQISQLSAHTDAVSSVAFSPDGVFLASSSRSGSIVLWGMNPLQGSWAGCGVVRRNFTRAEWKRFFGNDEPFHITCPSATSDEADALALVGDPAGAERLFDEALRAALRTGLPEANDYVCWYGSLDGFAALVKSACEKAVEDARTDRDLFYYRDSRGISRALSGDTAGAIDDLTAALGSYRELKELGAYGPKIVRRREDWIAALKEGRNPFDEKLLNALRTENPQE